MGCTVTQVQHRPLLAAPPTVVRAKSAVLPQSNGAPSTTSVYASFFPSSALVSPRPATVRDNVLDRHPYRKHHSITRESMAAVPVLPAVSPSSPLSPRHSSSLSPRARTYAVAQVPTEPVTGQHAVPLASVPLSPPVNSRATLAKRATSRPSSVVFQALDSQLTSAVQSASMAPDSSARPASPKPMSASQSASISTNTGTRPASPAPVWAKIKQQGADAQDSAWQQTIASPKVSPPQASTWQPVAVTHDSVLLQHHHISM